MAGEIIKNIWGAGNANNKVKKENFSQAQSSKSEWRRDMAILKVEKLTEAGKE